MWNARFRLRWYRRFDGMRQGVFGALLVLGLFSPAPDAWAVTYANVSYPFSWIDATGHNRLTGTSVPYKLNGGGGCGTNPPIIDDTISDLIPIGFTFNYGGVAYTNLRINTNGRIQFGNNAFCGSGTANVGPPQTYPYRYPDANPGASLRIYGADLDPTPQGTAGYTTNCVAGNCYLSYATIGTAPNRSFVVTWNNVPEWIGTSRAGGNFNLQIILQENGEFIYQYGVNVHGASGTAEIGWQVTTVDYAVPGFGLPTNNSAIKFYIPRPVAEYRMEQPAWNGTAGEVIDSSGNGRHGVRLGTTNTTDGRVCRGANIPADPAGAELATVNGVRTPVNMSTAVGGQGTITFWYKSNSAWNAANSDRQLFDASVAGSRWFFLTKRANGRLRFVLSDTGGTARALEVGANNTTAAGTWRHVAVTWNFNALAATNSDRMRIYIDGVQVAQSTFTTPETLFAGLANLVVGDNININSSGQSGSPKSADGVIDEFRIYNFEAGVGLIQRDMAASGCLGHYAVAATAGSTCQATQVTVSSHDSAHGLLVMPNNTTMITLSTSTGRGDWSLISGYGVLNNGTADDGIATYLFNGEYQAIFGYQTSSSGAVNFDVTDGQLREFEDPTVTVAACSVSFNACELVSGRCTPTAAPNLNYARLNTKLASTAFNLDVVALDSSGLLNSAFNGTVAVDLLANTDTGVALAGNNCPTGQTAVIPLGNVTYVSGRGPLAGLPVATNAFTSVSPSYAAYRDVRVRFTCDSTNCAPGGLTTCSSDNFAVRPTSFTVTSATMNNPSRTGAPKLAAGADFTLTATAVAGYNGAPQIDRRANPPTCFDAAMPNANKVLDHDGICIDRLYDLSAHTIVSFSAAAPATGAATGTFQYHDVGHFRLAPGGVYDSTYSAVDQPNDCVADSNSNAADASGKFGCNIGNTANTALFGRFYPDHFAVTAGSAAHGCPAGGFTYMGHPGIGLTYTIQAQSLINLVTTKYVTGYVAPGMGTVDLIALSDGASAGISGAPVTARITGWTSPNPAWVGGEQNIVGVPLTFSRPATTPDGPFNSVYFGARVSGDQDGVVITTRDMRDTGVACTGNACTHASLNSDRPPPPAVPTTAATPASVKFGYLRLIPALGSELLPLTMGAELLAFNGTAFVINGVDSCTALALPPFNTPAANPAGFSAWTNNLNIGETCVMSSRGTTCAAAGTTLTFNQGRGSIWLRAPGANNNGSVRVTADLDTPGLTYLKGNQGGANYNVNPWATATFGIYKGARQIIHMRENF